MSDESRRERRRRAKQLKREHTGDTTEKLHEDQRVARRGRGGDVTDTVKRASTGIVAYSGPIGS